MEPSELALFWAGVIAIAILVYVILDGFDVGVGILFGTTRDESRRRQMLTSISPFWDGNETWLVVVGASLFAAFPAVYAVFLGAFYLPVLLMLFGLIFRGIAFEFRYRSAGMRWFWDGGFFYGSVLIAFVQGAAVGAMIRGIPVENMQSRRRLRLAASFPILTGSGLSRLRVAGCRLARAQERRRVARLGLSPHPVARRRRDGRPVPGVHCHVRLPRLAQTGLYTRPWGPLFSVVCAISLTSILVGAGGLRDGLPFAMTVLFFVAAFLSLGVMFWPYMIPYSVTVASAASPDASLRFFFYGGIAVLPVIFAYTIGVYWVFRGKVRKPGVY